MIIHYSKYDSDDLGNGALRRTYQVKTLLSKTEEKILSISNPPRFENNVNYIKRLKIGYQFYRFFNTNIFDFKTFNLKIIKYNVYNIIAWRKWLIELKEVHENLTVVYELSWHSDYALVYVCNQLNIKVIGLPHNLESLVQGQKSPVNNINTPYWFDQELKLLSTCDRVFTISKEEQWLLSLYGVSSNYLPYVPSQKVIDFCGEIRRQRLQSKKTYYLSIGTASNPPTLEGFKVLISYFNDNKIEEELLIGGYQTELIKNVVNQITSNIKILGTLEETELKQLMINCKAIIIYQLPTTGALTKIPEILLSGIPIICNTVAARNYFNTKGVYVYDSKENLIELIKNKDIDSNFDYNLLDDSESFLRTINN
ncbi:hypothetical protein [Mesoflavibacter zeaxanthinifaciens]|uniref:hypothetical protein n=1 Tax=Mesoflavibacter zeaxanthinifaciens TaxID=393060 RepID=UPI003A8EA1B5